MKTFKNPEEEVDLWRLKIYEETKDMTPEQRSERNRINRKKSMEYAKKYGFKIVENAITMKEVNYEDS